MSLIKLVQGDTKPPLIVSLTDETTGDPLDLSTTLQVVLKFRKVGATDLADTLTGILLAGRVLADGSVDSSPPYNIGGAGGRVQFDWTAQALGGDAGRYEGEIEITYQDTRVQTPFNKLKFKVREDF